jgi:hypothetical protein
MHTHDQDFSPEAGHYANAFDQFLDPAVIRSHAPAVYAAGAHERTSRTYAFLSTSRLLDALADVGFLPVTAIQTRTRVASAEHARHAVRLRRRFETIDLADAIPELILLNSHDGTSAYQLRLGLYRVQCRNGLIVSEGAFAVFRVAHRGDILEELVRAAVRTAENFEALGMQVRRLEAITLSESQRFDFATRAAALRFPGGAPSGFDPAGLLTPRREEDRGASAWVTYNVVQENSLRGGIGYVPQLGRRRSTRGISSIKTNLRLNAGLWDEITAIAA